MESTTLIGYFSRRDEARKVFKELQRRGFHRAAMVSRTADGQIETWDPLPWRRVLGAIIGFVLFGSLSAVAVITLEWPEPIELGVRHAILPVLAGALFGVLLSEVIIRRSRFGVDRKLLQDHTRWLVANETVLILQAPAKSLQEPAAVLRGSDESRHALFVQHPSHIQPAGEAWGPAAPMSLAQIQEHARRMATDHAPPSALLPSTDLLVRLESARKWVHEVVSDLSEANRLEQSLPPTTEWLLDNEYIVESNARDVQKALPDHYYRELRAASGEPHKGLPLIYGIARELVAHTDSNLSQGNIVAAVDAYQLVSQLTLGELWAFPQMLRIALIETIQHLSTRALTELRERELADFWANRLITANRRDPSHLFSILSELTATHPDPSPYFASQLIDHLYDEAAALVPVQSWLERSLRQSITDLHLAEQNRQTKDQIAIGNAFGSLRRLAVLDWRLIFERLSRVEEMLRLDPAGVYPKMDFDTRDRYRRAVEALSRRSGRSEEAVTEQALELAATALREAHEDKRNVHVGTYLIGAGRRKLARILACNEAPRYRLLHWVYRRHTPIYFLALGGLTLLLGGIFLALGLQSQPLWIQALVVVLALFPSSQLGLDVVNYLITRLLPPRVLPKLDFSVSGIPDAYRTLVVVPVMLRNLKSIRSDVELLEIRYLANKEANLLYGLFTDYTDATQQECDGDAELIGAARSQIEALNSQYDGQRFFLFHRKRTWCECEQKFIGWERKRGKLEELNDLIDGTRRDDAEPLVYVGDPDRLANVRFVITLDADTQLPRNAARRMIETIAHPLNQPRFESDGRIVAGTYTLIQPRVSPSLPSASGSAFSRLFADAIGVDPYTKAVSDAHQDLAGEGSYHGKGIYDVRAFSRTLSGRFPEQLLLSHDLIEGAHVNVGLASDIELYDEFPQDYLSYSMRQHRWIRGDWQIADWVLPWVPRPGGGRRSNDLSWFDRWKIADNLRRSLVPAASVALLVSTWLFGGSAVWLAALIIALVILFHPLAQPITVATTREGYKSFSLKKARHDLRRALVEAAFLPHQAGLALDAIWRVWYRRLISGRRLLNWIPAQASSGLASNRPVWTMLSISLASVFSGLAAFAVLRWMPTSFPMALPWLALWFVSPVFGFLLARRTPARRRKRALSSVQRTFLRIVARRTWRYFAEFVSDQTAWLPPDNYQVSHKDKLAMRTSPTNIGMAMVTTLAAGDFGYLTPAQIISNLSKTMDSIEQLERYEGHLLNWYDIGTLEPLEPRYVSTVDSGNLLGSLWSLQHGLDELVSQPIVDKRMFAGLKDTARILHELVGQTDTTDVDGDVLRAILGDLAQLPSSLGDRLRLARRISERAAGLLRNTSESPEKPPETTYWAQQVNGHCESWLVVSHRFLKWVDLLDEFQEDVSSAPELDALIQYRSQLVRAPSLRELADADDLCSVVVRNIRKQPVTYSDSVSEKLDRLEEALDQAQKRAREVVDANTRLITRVRELCESFNMHFLYDTDRRLFAVGYNVSDGRLDSSYYDLLASEARFGSYVAIARGDVPAEHWFSMSRPYNSYGRQKVLLSWTGTMFEYLMPLLFQKAHDHSLLDQAARAAVTVQMDYGRKRMVPWGISESAFGDLDVNQTYQYKAFGVPALGLKRGLMTELVVAPYATLLAANVDPAETVKNLTHLAELGLLNAYGFYEAIDFSRRPTRGGERGVIVRAYMAHHQGMGFLALTNLLHNNAVQRRFHSDPRVRAVESLLHERIPVRPPLLHHVSARDRIQPVAGSADMTPSASQFDTPHTPTPKTQLLSNGRYGLMITNAGSGYSHWNDMEITRFRADRTSDTWGSFCYIRDVDSDRCWSNTYHPTGGEPAEYNASLGLERAVIRRMDDDIHTETEVVVSPEDDVEIRRIKLINRSTKTRTLELTSYYELSLAPHKADRQHPAFNKMFIQTEALPELDVLLAHRRSRKDDDPPVFVAHRITEESSSQEPFRFETDRRRFIGRGRTLAAPMGAFQEPTNCHGFVLDPVLSLRRRVTLGPNERVQLSLILAAGESRDEVLRLAAVYAQPDAIDRAMDFAWASSQLELRLLRIQPDDARRFQQIASHMHYPNPVLRPPADIIAANHKGQSGLWPYGISGDLPIALITIADPGDITLVRQMLQAHVYWRRHGLKADLVILNEEAPGYEKPLRERLDRLIQTHAIFTGIDEPGGIYLRSSDVIPPEDLTLLKAAANVMLVAARGTLLRQIGLAPELPERLGGKREAREPSAPLPMLELPYFNSLGGFTPDGSEYAVYMGPHTHTPAPWINVMATPEFGTLVSETGAGFTWFGNSQRNRLTEWSNDPVTDPPSEAVYIRDEESGVFWTPTASPIREETAYRARHGAGYTVFEHNSQGIEQELTVFVPMDDTGGVPVKLQRLRLKNDSGRGRKLSVTYYVEWTLGENRESSQMHVVTAWEQEVHAVFARNPYHPDYAHRVSFVAMNTPADSYSGDRTYFLGRNHSLDNPSAMEHVNLSKRTGAGLDPCGAVQVHLELAPGETKEITCMLGQAESAEAARACALSYWDALSVETALSTTIAWWDGVLEQVKVTTPELSVDFMMNRWLLYQSLSCRVWGRSALYQSGGAFGYRDQLQDVMAFLHTKPDLAREHILLAASRQFKEGDVQHWWHPPSGVGIRSRITDDLLWLPYVVAEYVRTTGDASILHMEVPFLDAPLLEDDQHEVMTTPEVSNERGSIFDHCKRAVARSSVFGGHGLPLMGTGDWNDGMNSVGEGGKGESVWLAWFLIEVLKGMGELADVLGQPDLKRAYEKDRTSLAEKVEQAAWDGEWYLRAYFDDGSKLGSSTSSEAKIDSLPQSWAVLTRAADPKRAHQAMESAWQHLVREDEGLVLLFDPPFEKSVPSPGYIKGYPPGVRENGGQYTHAAIWYAMAMARGGEGTKAAKILRMLNPIEHAREAETVWRYGVEPYVVSADVYRLPERIGHGGWSWYTGSAAWMYRAWLEEVLGLKVRGNQMHINPVIPDHWDGFDVRYKHGEAIYEIRVENPDGVQRGVASVEMNGRRLADGVIPLERDLVKHRVIVQMGALAHTSPDGRMQPQKDRD